MAYVHNRGTKKAPNYHARYRDSDGKWRMVKVPDQHSASKRDAEKWIEGEQEKIDKGRPDPRRSRTFAELADEWSKTLRNRSARTDRSRLTIHLMPHFGVYKVGEINEAVILDWIDKQRQTVKQRKGKGTLSEDTIGKSLSVLKRFFKWCMPRHITENPVSKVGDDKRPAPVEKLIGELPWIDDDKTVRDLYRALPAPFNLIFYIGNRCGARVGELCGLRLGSFADVDRGYVTIRYTYDGGFLKEDKRCRGISKKAPIPADLAALVKAHIERRKAEGATSDSLMFPNPLHEGRAYSANDVDRVWNRACAAVGFVKTHAEDIGLPEEKRRQTHACTFYEATRHSYASRRMRDSQGRDAFVIAKSMGHRDTSMLTKHYGRWIPTEFSDDMRAGLGLDVDQGGEIVPLRQTA